jgi:hypothetical protein
VGQRGTAVRLDEMAGAWESLARFTKPGHLAGTTGIGGRIMTAIWPIEVEFPQLNRSVEIYAQFTNDLPTDVHGLLGNPGFLDRFSKVCFLPRLGKFSIEV